MTEADDALVLRSQKQDREAFEELVRRTARLVYARVCLEVGRAASAEDLVQETFLAAWRSIRQVADPSGFRPWLLSIARSVAVDALRRRSRLKRAGPPGMRRVGTSGDPDGDPLADLPDRAPEPPEAAEREEARQRVLGVLRSLPDEYRLPLTMRYLAGADYSTIARQLGLTDGSLRGLLNRGMAMLRREMKRGEVGEAE